MLVVFANNQVLVTAASTSVEITTDPVAVGSNNRGTAVTNVHGMFNAGVDGLEWVTQISMDGQTWVDQGPAQVAASITAVGEYLANNGIPVAVTGVYVRLKIKFTASAAGVGAATFDIHVNFDHE